MQLVLDFKVFCVYTCDSSVYRPSDPYAMPGLEEDVPRPPTVKADDLKSMELVDDDDEGWAGHHEEVDYSKEVVFSDSSDDEAMPKEAKMVGYYLGSK